MALALLAACGQKGPLFIPDTPAAQQRASLPQAVLGYGGKTAAPAATASDAAEGAQTVYLPGTRTPVVTPALPPPPSSMHSPSLPGE